MEVKLSHFGKVIRKIRIDHGIRQMDMASDLGLSASYLSSIEYGKRPAPEDLCDKIRMVYKRFSKEELQAIESAILRDNNAVVIKLDACSDDLQNLILYIKDNPSQAESRVGELSRILMHGEDDDGV